MSNIDKDSYVIIKEGVERLIRDYYSLPKDSPLRKYIKQELYSIEDDINDILSKR